MLNTYFEILISVLSPLKLKIKQYQLKNDEKEKTTQFTCTAK